MAATTTATTRPEKKDSRFNADIVIIGEKPVPESAKKLLALTTQKNRKI